MKISVKNLAKIKQAEIEIKPLTVFFGNNNTNKSLLAHVVYGVYKEIPVLEFFTVNKILKNKTPFDLKQELKKIDVDDSNFQKELKKQIVDMFNEKDFSKRFSIKIEGYTEHKKRVEEYEKLINSKNLFSLHSFISKTIDRVVYFPASRTGFMLSLDDLIAGLMERRFEIDYVQQHQSMLTKPVVEFLIKIHRLKSSVYEKESKDTQTEKALEILSSMMQGRIIKDDDKRQFKYKPDSLKKTIPFHLVSSSVIELAPLYVVLDSYQTIKDKIFIIEEPEAHLHPLNQIRIAEFIVFLVNSGAKVLITTHSDYILSSLNLCLKRFWAEEKQDSSKYIDPQNLAVYWFVENKNKIEVEPIPAEKPEGVSFKNFDKAADYLYEEADRLNDKLYGKKQYLSAGEIIE